MLDEHLTKYVTDWLFPVGNIALGALLLSNDPLLITKEIVIVAGILIGIATNIVRLWKDLKQKKEEEKKDDVDEK